MEGTANQVIPEGSAQLYPRGRARLKQGFFCPYCVDDNNSLLIQAADSLTQPTYFYCGGKNRQGSVLEGQEVLGEQRSSEPAFFTTNGSPFKIKGVEMYKYYHCSTLFCPFLRMNTGYFYS